MTDVWAQLSEPIPPEHISQREGAGGRMLEYIDRPVVWDRLDAAALGEWTAEFRGLPMMDNNTEPHAMICKLAVNGVVREGVGQGKDWKEAETDAFKRAAVHFGIGRQLYGTVGEGKPVPQKAAASRSKPSSPRSSSSPTGEKMPFGKHKGKPLADVPDDDLRGAIDWCNSTDAEKFASAIRKFEMELSRRGKVQRVQANESGGVGLPDDEDSSLPF